MSFLNPLLLLGALFAVIPIIIHFLNKSRYRTEPFGAMMFLFPAAHIHPKPLKIRQALLLFLRALFFILLATALARPATSPAEVTGGHAPRTHVLILDTSLSMRAGQGAQNAFRQAREAGLRIISRFVKKGDNIQIISADRTPEASFDRPIYNRNRAKKKLRELTPTFERTDMMRSVNRALESIQRSQLPGHRIYVLTDGQKYAWHFDKTDEWRKLSRQYAAADIDPAVYVLAQAPSNFSSNVGVTDVTSISHALNTRSASTFRAELRNSGETAKKITASFFIDDRRAQERTITVSPRNVATVEFSHRFRSPGPHVITVEIPNDVLPADNSRSMAVKVADTIPVLLIQDRHTSEDAPGNAVFFRQAIAASGTGNPEEQLFQATTATIEELKQMRSEQLSQFKVVVLADLKSIPEYAVFNLERYVEQGGNLFITTGSRVRPESYQKFYQGGNGVLPAQPDRIKSSSGDFFKPFTTASSAERNSYTGTAPFLQSHFLRNIQIRKYWITSPARDANISARSREHPFVVSKFYGKGKSLLTTCPLDGSWSNLPFTQAYVPFVQDLMLWLATEAEIENNLRPGTPIRANLTATESASLGGAGGDSPGASENDSRPNSTGDAPNITLTLPSGKTVTVSLEREAGRQRVVYRDTNIPGPYTLTLPNDSRRKYAVQAPGSESEAKLLKPDDLGEITQFFHLARISTVADLFQQVQKDTEGREWWQLILFLAIGVLCIELFLSSKLNPRTT